LPKWKGFLGVDWFNSSIQIYKEDINTPLDVHQEVLF
jgi:hypothetical protein